MNVETLLTERIGDAGKRLHTARSRNDQVAAGFPACTWQQEIGTIVGQTLHLQRLLCAKAKQYHDAVMPGYTHLQRAQPITFAHASDGLCQDAPPGRHPPGGLPRAAWTSAPWARGALAGTTYPIDRDA